jgi:DNA-binding XRE family transcriptional regulator
MKHKGVESMPFVVANKEKEAKKLQSLIKSDIAVKQHIKAWEEEYEFRKKLVIARKEAGLSQKDVEKLSGLNQRAVSRIEANSGTTPSVKTLIKYLNALGYKLDIKKATG